MFANRDKQIKILNSNMVESFTVEGYVFQNFNVNRLLIIYYHLFVRKNRMWQYRDFKGVVQIRRGNKDNLGKIVHISP